MRHLLSAAAVLVGCAALCVGCTTNSPGTMGYESRAATTAERMISPVATGQLLAELGARGNLLGPYAKTTTTNALDEADTIQSGWDQIQPPGPQSERGQSKAQREAEAAARRLEERRTDNALLDRDGEAGE